jgi:arylsulfatase A-like enzyme
MKVGSPAPSRAAAGTLAAPRLFPLFCAALSALALLWLPLALLHEVDALLFFTPARQVASDFALLWPLATLVALALALAGRAGAAIAGRLGRGNDAQARVAWSFILVPLGWLIAWQVVRSLRLWLQATTGLTLSVGSHTRIVGIVVLALAMLWLWRRFGADRVGRRAIESLLALRAPALLLTAAATLLVIVSPPALRAAPTPSAVKSAADAPDVLLITIDALAAEDAAVCGTGPTPMPRLRALAQRATCFDRFYASANFTTPTTSTIETGTLPWTHQAAQIAAKLAPALRGQTVAAQLRAVGYRTHFVTDNFLASPLHHGSWRAWDEQPFARSLTRNRLRETMTVVPDTVLPLVTDAILSFAGALDFYLHGERNPYASALAYAPVPGMLNAPVAPSFVWVHTMPPHAPYLPPPSTRHRLLAAGELERWHQLLPENMAYRDRAQPLVDKHRLRYRESIMGADEDLGRLLDELERQGRLDRMLVVISADHGESFERNFIGHAGHLLHEAVIRIPLVVKLPGQTKGHFVVQPVSQADLAPTLLDLTGAAPLPLAAGRSLRPLLEGAALAAEPVFSMSMERQSRFAPIRAGHYAVIDGAHKLIWDLAADQLELYDLVADPRERDNLAERQPERAARLKALLRERIERAESQRERLVAGPSP